VIRWLKYACLGMLLVAPAVRPALAAPARSGLRLVRIAVQPERVTLSGPGAVQRLVVTGRYADGSVRDLTGVARVRSLAPAVAGASGTAPILFARRDGRAIVVVTVAEAPAVRVPVEVRGTAAERTISFHNDVIPVLTRMGCNQGRCHGTPTGKGGFRLSLQGYAPEADWKTIALEGAGRRAVRGEPARSLLLLKPTLTVAHGGGKILRPDQPEFQILARWIAAGLPHDPPDAPRAIRLEVLPGPRLLEAPYVRQQLVVIAHYSDGSSRDVTGLCKFTASNDDIATVDEHGVVRGKGRGEVAILCRYGNVVQSVRLIFRRPVPNFRWTAGVTAKNVIDRHLFARLRLLRIAPSPVCSDTEFIRRAYLDAIATLPTPEEVRAFLADRDPHKREKLVDRLLERPEFADFWTLKWADLLRIRERALGATAARAYLDWIRQSIASDKPLTQFVAEMLTAQGSSTTQPAVNYYRVTSEPENWVEQTSQLFLGIRIQCAKCHNHPFDRWTQDEYYAFAAFFAGVQTGRDGVRLGSGTVIQPRTGQIMTPKLLGGPEVPVEPGRDPRVRLAEWLTDPANPFFARAMANRIWFHVMGRGLVEPVDDFRESNPAVSEELLDALKDALVQNGFRLKPLVRLIMTSRAYELSAEPTPLNADDHVYFSRAAIRLLTAEQLMDAIAQATGVPDPQRAIRDHSDRPHPFLQVFGRPERQLPCECERTTESTLFQALQLLSARFIDEKLRSPQGRVAQLAESGRPIEECVEELYLAFLSRPPAPAERARIVAAVRENPDRRAALEDLAWALLNSKEFMFRH